MREYDFCGWATKNDIKCSDGRVIRKDAFKECDGTTVPLVWNHQHNDPISILGHALLENRSNGVYAYGYFNDTDAAQNAKEQIKHRDITMLSIYANQLKQVGSDVVHGAIREVSLVLAGANKGARIESFFEHSEDGLYEDDEAIIYSGDEIELYHSDDGEQKKEKKDMAAERTIQEIFDSMDEEQQDAVYAMLAAAIEAATEEDEDEEDDEMGHNIFENDDRDNALSHDALNTIISDAKRYGTLKESFLAHADDYGIEQIDWLFPEPENLNNPPEFIKRNTDWVSKVMNGVHRSPFSRIKSMFANITEDDARAKGYIKGSLKKEEVFTLLKRTTTPTTIYKKQKIDRDDQVDITDFDVVAWLKQEMRTMLDEEIARAILVGDGRLPSSDDKIDETHIRPIAHDEDLYTIKAKVNVSSSATEDEIAKAFIRTTVKSRKDYKGSGSPVMYTTEDLLTNMLLLEDTTGRIIYDSEEKLRNALRVREIVTVPVMENAKTKDSKPLMAIIVNLSDYNVGADKGGAINMFDDFDIDYNQQKYLIETRCSGALTKPYSAIAIELDKA